MSTWGQAVSEGLKRPGQREKFKKIQVEQMRELLTNYGPTTGMLPIRTAFGVLLPTLLVSCNLDMVIYGG